MAKAKILVVEDEGIVARDIQNRLTQLGYLVPHIVGSGEDALRCVAEDSPELILMDIRLAGGERNGLDVGEEIGHAHDIPILYLTAYADAATVERAKRTNVYGFILKPFQMRELRIAIELALERHRIDRLQRRNCAWLQATVKSMRMGVIAADRGAAVRFLNPVAEMLTGWTIEEAAGQPLEKVFAVQDVGEDDAGARLPSRKGETMPAVGSRRLTLRSRDERPVQVVASMSTIRGSGGQDMGTVLTFEAVQL